MWIAEDEIQGSDTIELCRAASQAGDVQAEAVTDSIRLVKKAAWRLWVGINLHYGCETVSLH
jgi:hypothetical protein